MGWGWLLARAYKMTQIYFTGNFSVFLNTNLSLSLSLSLSPSLSLSLSVCLSSKTFFSLKAC